MKKRKFSFENQNLIPDNFFLIPSLILKLNKSLQFSMNENVLKLENNFNQVIERKIAVIFVTDVVGFSKLMEINEDETLKSFRACRDILDNLFSEYGGRIFNTAGDSVLAEFQSAVSAVICASEFQKLIKERNRGII